MPGLSSPNPPFPSAKNIYQVNAFAHRPFTGNPAAVCILDHMPENDWLLGVAKDMNLSETAFLLRQEDGWQLRWFTPSVEVDLCGHATLAASFVLFRYGYEAADAQIRFATRSGELQVTQAGDWLQMNFPAEKPSPSPAPAGLTEALGCEASYVGKNRMDYLVEVANEEILHQLRPDFQAIREIPARGVIVTCQATAGEKHDYASRFFGPAVGVDEDPVTGSAHCCLAPYWAAKLGRDSLTGYQASARGGYVRTTLSGDRVLLEGQALPVFEGTLLI